ncbi:hypothetical protein B0H13DRAFT_1881102 [Mycena leptocephala]|nr:hypothetical protein B0H13DRAFT_1881102 [Mycena leptocephala]
MSSSSSSFSGFDGDIEVGLGDFELYVVLDTSAIRVKFELQEVELTEPVFCFSASTAVAMKSVVFVGWLRGYRKCDTTTHMSKVPSWITRKDPRQMHPRRQGNVVGAEPLYTFLSILTVLLASDPSVFPPLSRTPCLRVRGAFHLCLALASSTAPARSAQRTWNSPHLLASVFTLKYRSPPKFHSLDIPLDAEVWHGAARYLPAVATDATTPIPPFLRPLSHLTNFISRLKTRAKASDERRMYSVAGGVKRAE